MSATRASRSASPPPVRDVTRHDADYPRGLEDLSKPPAVITVQGPTAMPVGQAIVAIVGSRRATVESAKFARDLAFACARAGIIVASGGAVGVDYAAHVGAIEAKGTTWAVLGTSCDRVFPREHAGLYRRIATIGGTVVWPFPKGTAVSSRSFPKRNKILVALASAVVVIQAREQSGSMNAATAASDLGRELWVVPAHPWDLEYAGSIDLLRTGRARPLVDPDQFVERFHATTRLAIETRERPLSDEAQRLLAAAEMTPLTRDELVRRAGLTPSAAATALLTLALAGVLVEGSDGTFRRAL